MNQPRISLFFDYRKPIKDGVDKGKCHIKLLLNYYERGIRQRRCYKTGVFATADEFVKIQTGKFGKGGDDLIKSRAVLQSLEEKANKCLINFTTGEEFEKRFYSKGNFENPLDFMLNYADEMDRAGRIGNRDAIKQAHSSFHKFSNGRLTFSMVTPSWLTRYENRMVEDGRSITTVGIYCRVMRTIFNLARSNRYKVISSEVYPFGMSSKGLYQIPTTKRRKMALSEAQKDKVLSFKTIDSQIRRAVDMWIFSYFCNGMNFSDIARLKFKDIDNDLLTFTRAKTQLTKRDQEPIEAIVTERVREIIAVHGNKPGNPNDYIFPVLQHGLTPSQVKDRIHDFIDETNEGLAVMCTSLEIPKITTYWARHTYVMILKGKNVDTSFIKKALGHGNEKTTESYIDSFDMETKKRVANLL